MMTKLKFIEITCIIYIYYAHTVGVCTVHDRDAFWWMTSLFLGGYFIVL